MKKIKIQNQPFGPFPTMIIGADVNGKPNYVTVGACLGSEFEASALCFTKKHPLYNTRG